MNLLRTALFLPGNNPGMLQNGGVFGADAVILDLEDAVSPNEKDAARQLVKNALQTVDYRNAKKIVRINPMDLGGVTDIKAIIPAKPDMILVPKINHAQEIIEAIQLIEQMESDNQKTLVIPLIETAQGVVNINNIVAADERIRSVVFGAEDYTASLGVARSKDGQEIYTARTLIVNAAAAVGIDAIDTPFTDVQDDEGLLNDTLLSKKLGFKGKLAINPRQIDVIHEAFAPTTQEINWSVRVIHAIEQAAKAGSGVISLDGKMIDAPIVHRAERTLAIAKYLNLLTGELS